MPQKNISKDIPFTSTKFKFSVDDGLQFPNRINPTFPPFCVQCGQPATEYVEEVGQARKQVGNAQYGETSGGRRGTQTNYLVTKMVVKVPFCLSHAEDTRRRKKIGNTSLGISVGISVFIQYLRQLCGESIVLTSTYAAEAGEMSPNA